MSVMAAEATTLLDAGPAPEPGVCLRLLLDCEHGCWFDRRAAGGVSLLMLDPDLVLTEPEEVWVGLRAHGGAAASGPFGFASGWAGYLGYEGTVAALGLPPPSPCARPLVSLSHYAAALAVDHRARRAWAVGRGDAGRAGAEALIRRVDRARRAPLRDPGAAHVSMAVLDPGPSPRAYAAQVREVQGWIRRGETYVANLTYRIRLGAIRDPAAAYNRLSAAHPSPYAALLRAGPQWVLSSSPELLLCRRGTRAWTRPIKGTRAGAAGAAALAADAKERAELAMIVDMERNDLGQVARPGTVRVPEIFAVEAHPGLLHLVATVEAQVPGRAGDLVRSVLPGGSVTGAPKRRTVELLAALEGDPRGVYTGAVGYCDDGGDMEWSVAIRTLECVPEMTLYGTGGGITSDSDPEREYAETRLKARGPLRALGVDVC